MEDIRKIVRISNKLSNILETDNPVFKKLAKFEAYLDQLADFKNVNKTVVIHQHV